MNVASSLLLLAIPLLSFVPEPSFGGSLPNSMKLHDDVLKVGSTSFSFTYGGSIEAFSRVTITFDDSIGRILHFESRHNDQCAGNPPELRLNTKTNGKFDEPQIETFPSGQYSYTWNIIPEEGGFLIQNGINNEQSFNFPYREPHSILDVKQIQMYDAKDHQCPTDYNYYSFIGELYLKQEIPSIAKELVIEGKLAIGSGPQYEGRVKFHFTNLNILIYFYAADISIMKNSGSLFAGFESSYMTFPSNIEASLFKISLKPRKNDKVLLTITVGDQVNSWTFGTAETSYEGVAHCSLSEMIKFEIL